MIIIMIYYELIMSWLWYRYYDEVDVLICFMIMYDDLLWLWISQLDSGCLIILRLRTAQILRFLLFFDGEFRTFRNPSSA